MAYNHGMKKLKPQTKTVTLRIRATPEEERVWSEAARRASRSMSGWLRYAANTIVTLVEGK
jgi:uncharacterized protein (DUF1778 family)